MARGGTLDIGEVVEATGVPTTTLHVWERHGIVEPVGRSGLRRQYDAAVVGRIAMVRAFQLGGFTLREIGGILDRRVDARAMLQEKLALLREQRRHLDVVIDALEHGVRCHVPHPADCEVFAAKASALTPTSAPTAIDKGLIRTTGRAPGM
jgi:DNA-binding transcriptional MerR regulator